MREFYGMDSKGTGSAKERADDYKLAKQLKKKSCECTSPTRVFPEPPCDVFRAANPARTAEIEGAWNQHREDFVKAFSAPLENYAYFLNLMIGSHPPADATRIRGAAKMRKGEMKGNKWGQLWKEYDLESKKLVRINHLVPKEAGGCPTNTNNLQPQQILCPICQDIDQMMTDHWQG